MSMTKYNPEIRYEFDSVRGRSGELPGGTQIVWPDGDHGIVIKSFSDNRHLIEYRVVGGGTKQATFTAAELADVMVSANPILPRGRSGGRNAIADEPMERHNITISADLWRKAAIAGNGNASEGIRKALEQMQ